MRLGLNRRSPGDWGNLPRYQRAPREGAPIRTFLLLRLIGPTYGIIPENEAQSTAPGRLCKLAPSFIGRSVNRGLPPGISPGANSAPRPPTPPSNYI